MSRKIKIIGLFLLIGQIFYGQTNKEKALTKGQEAVQLVDNGKIDEGIKLLQEAQNLDPDRFDYPYELAYAYYQKQDYKGAIEISEKLVNHKDAEPQLFQLLGNCYDILNNPNKAFEIYDAGLKKFPNAGNLYLEKGNVYWNREEYEKALPYYEKGIEVDPDFPSNYYKATRVYFKSTEKVWGMVYGEIFMNLERNTDRTSEISKLLYDTYKNGITLKNNDSISVNFSKSISLNPDEKMDSPDNVKSLFVFVYEINLLVPPTLPLSEKTININTLDEIRSTFIDRYFKYGYGFDKKFSNVLFSYQKKVKDAGHIEAYNHWILMKGDEDGFNEWRSGNKEKWDSFVDWFTDNKLKIDKNNKLVSEQH
jgi:tetratricopeptide (TPR) repeat protein